MNKPNMTWVPSPNHSSPEGYKFIAIVDHIMSGTLDGTDSWFQNPDSQVSSHFGVGKNGEIHQYVDLQYPAWANGFVANPSWPLLQSGINPNYYTISIEHEGNSGDIFTEAQYQATLALHKWLIEVLGIPVNRDTIIGHYRIDSVNKANCPGSGFPWDRLFSDLQGGNKQVKNLVVVKNGVDEKIAFYLSWKYNAPIVFADSVSQEDINNAQTIFEVGGTQTISKSIIFSGSSRFETAQKVLDYIKMH